MRYIISYHANGEKIGSEIKLTKEYIKIVYLSPESM